MTLFLEPPKVFLENQIGMLLPVTMNVQVKTMYIFVFSARHTESFMFSF